MQNVATKVVSVLSTLTILFMPLFVFAQGTGTTLLANVSIYGTSIVQQQNGALMVNFSIENGAGAQSNVKYGIQVMQTSSSGQQSLVDEDIATNTLSLPEGQSLQRTVNYTPPAFLSGAYQIWIIVENTSGLPLAAVLAGKVTLTSTQGYVNILSPTCFLSVAGDKTQYTPEQGVDILPTETLVATCQVLNHFTTSQTVWPNFETLNRSEFGDVVPTNSLPQATTTLVAGNTAQTISFALPMAQVPQAYDVQMALVNTSGTPISNTVIFHYVLRGASATIQNAILDKDQYARGDTAHVTVFWTPSADSFPGSRYGSATSTGDFSLDLVLKNGNGSQCASAVTQEVAVSGISTIISLPITASCINPSLLVYLKDPDGTVLDQKIFAEVSTVVPSKNTHIKAIFLWIGGILILGIVGYLIYMRLRRSTEHKNT